MAAASKEVDRDLQELQENIDDIFAQICEKCKDGEGVVKMSAIEKQNKIKKEIAQLALDLFSLLIDAQSAVTSVIKQKKQQIKDKRTVTGISNL